MKPSDKCQRCLRQAHWARDSLAPAPVRYNPPSSPRTDYRYDRVPKQVSFSPKKYQRHQGSPTPRRSKWQQPRSKPMYRQATYFVDDMSSSDCSDEFDLDHSHSANDIMDGIEEVHDKYSRSFDEQLSTADHLGNTQQRESYPPQSVNTITLCNEFSPISINKENPTEKATDHTACIQV